MMIPLMLTSLWVSSTPVLNPQARTTGATVMLWQLDGPLDGIPKIVEGQVPNAYFVAPSLKISGPFKVDGGTINQNLYGEVSTRLKIDKSGTYDFEVRTNAKLRMTVSGEAMLNTTDAVFQVSPGVYRGQYRLAAGATNMKFVLMHNDGDLKLEALWKTTTETTYRSFTPSEISTDAGQTFVVSPGPKRADLGKPKTRPGDRRPLESVHPSFKLEEFRGDDFRPAVGGMTFMPDGRLAICTWDEQGAVYLLEGLQRGKAKVKLFANGLGEPLGIAYWKGDLYVTQKGEVTRLRDTDADGLADEYQVVASGWGVSPNYHEFTFNLLPFGGQFYISSSVPLRGGHTNYTPEIDNNNPAYSTPNGPGRVYKIDPATGKSTAIAKGLRTPNGMNIGVDGKLFVADNQGSWLPSSPLYCIDDYDTFLHPDTPTGKPNLESVAVYFPHGEIGNSPSQMVLIPDGPYRGQMLIGDVTHGGLKRVQLEKVGGKYQGVAFRHSQGLEAGVNRVVWGPDNCLYVGGVGSNGNWNHKGHKFGLERLRPTGKVPFEMLEVGARKGGFQINFTKPMSKESVALLEKMTIRTWQYVPTIGYGGPKIGEKSLKIAKIGVTPDRREVLLSIPDLEAGSMVYFNLGDVKSEQGELLWSPEAWYTLQRIPSAVQRTPVRGELFAAPPKGADILIGKGGKGKLAPKDPKNKWKVVGDSLEVIHDGSKSIGGADHFSTEKYGDSLVHVEWLSPAGGELKSQTNGNSGVKLQSAYEIQMMNMPGIVDLSSPAAKFNEAGSIYRQTPPTWNPSYGAGVWQSYDIWFTPPVWENGKKVKNARATVFWNGIMVHNDAEIKDKTGLSDPVVPGVFPLLLQDHHSTAEGGVRFRNTWVLRDPVARGILPPK